MRATAGKNWANENEMGIHIADAKRKESDVAGRDVLRETHGDTLTQKKVFATGPRRLRVNPVSAFRFVTAPLLCS